MYIENFFRLTGVSISTVALVRAIGIKAFTIGQTRVVGPVETLVNIKCTVSASPAWNNT